MNISTRAAEPAITILDINEERLEYPKTVVLKNQVVRLLQAGKRHLLLNLEAVRSLDSFGLAVIISLMKECRANEGALAIYGLNDFNQRLVEMTKLNQVLSIGRSEQEAITLVQGGQAETADV